MSSYSPRYPGPRWSIHFGCREGVEKFALEELHAVAQSCLPYTIEVRAAADCEPREHGLLLGTPDNHPLIRQLVQENRLRMPDQPEGFTIASIPSPWNAQCRLVVIAGNTPVAVLYGVETLNSQVLSKKAGLEPSRCALNGLVDFEIRDYPRIAERGIWTWGYVIYDYRRFLDHMARLRLNTLTIWNDTPPLNCQDVIEYAHTRGIQVILGFPWGWGMEYDLSDPADRSRIEAQVLQHYQTEIAPLTPDGIYFQTLTEHRNTRLGERSVATITCELVNEIAAKLYAITPGLKIQFGLHATSIQNNYADLNGLDPRVAIIWEDAGALPYSYTPRLKDRGRSFAKTLAYSTDLAAFRPRTPFGMVPKGWTCLDWLHEFEHHQAYLLGARSRRHIRLKFARLRPRWALVNLLWRLFYRKGIEFYRSMFEVTQGNMIVQALVEDGLLEERIQPALSLYAETLWNPLEDARNILNQSRSAYYRET
jgi:hypothetical protein